MGVCEIRQRCSKGLLAGQPLLGTCTLPDLLRNLARSRAMVVLDTLVSLVLYRFSHDLTKLQTTKLLIPLKFYFHDV